MRLAGRLKALAKWVPQGASLADIGTDHALLPLYLLAQDLIPHAIATDCSPGPLAAAERELKKHGLAERVELRLGDGLKSLRPGEVDTVSVAGMGALTICGIMESDRAVLDSLKLLLLQPIGGAPLVRRWLAQHCWEIFDEDLALDQGRYYEALCARPGGQMLTEQEILIGPVLLAKRHPHLKSYLEECARRWLAVESGLERGHRGVGETHRLQQVRKTIIMLEEVRSWL